MAVRAFKKFTIVAGGTPQPLIGTTLTAAQPAVGAPRDVQGPTGLYTYPVADSSMFANKDWIVIGKPSTGETRLLVMAVPNATSVTVQVPRTGIPTYANGTYVRLSALNNSCYVQTTQGNAGAIYVGTKDTLVIATQAFVIALLYPVTAPAQPVEFRDGRSGLANADDIGQYWVDGTTGDGYLPSFGAM